MSAIPAAVAQVLGRPEPAADPAAARLVRAALEALQQRSGQTVEAKVVGPLPGGLTQFSAGGETFILKLETPLPPGTAVTIRIATTPEGKPAITIQTQQAALPLAAAPAPLPQVAASLLAQASLAPETPGVVAPQPAGSQVLSPQQPAPATAAISLQPAPVAVVTTLPDLPAMQPPPPPAAAPTILAGGSAAPVPIAVPTALPATTIPVASLPLAPSSVPVAAAPITVTPGSPAALAQPAQVAPSPPVQVVTLQTTVQPVSQTTAPLPSSAPIPVVAATLLPVAPAMPGISIPQPIPPAAQAQAMPAGAVASTSPPQPPPAIPQLSSAPALTPATPPAFVPAPLSSIPAAYPKPADQPAAAIAVPPPVPTPLSPSSISRPAAPPPPSQPAPPAYAGPVRATTPTSAPVPAPLTLTDPVQAAARQDSSAPLLAKLSALAATSAALPRPVIEAALKVMATRIDLNRALPTGAALQQAVLGAGVLADAAVVQPADAKAALLQLRAALVAVLGGEIVAPPPALRRPTPPLRGENPRAPHGEVPPVGDDTPHDAARTLLGHTDGALSRLKLLQLASQPADPRSSGPAAPAEYRVEIPMLLGAETGIVQLQIQRDGRNKSKPSERGWRMRFALSFAAIGEVGAEVAVLGRSASVALWAADPDTADALEAMLPELAPALAARGLEVSGVRLRRGPPAAAARAPGQLLDSAR